MIDSSKLARAASRRDPSRRSVLAGLAGGAVVAATGLGPSFAGAAAKPLKIGFSMALTGALAGNGKAALVAIELWRDDVNAKGGLLGRPVQLVYYDDQTNPALVPGIYSKLLDVDQVDLVVGGYGTVVQAAAMPIIIQRDKLFLCLVGTDVNAAFHYDKYFQMQPTGPDSHIGTSVGYFDAAMTLNPKPTTVAIVGADTEFSRVVAEGARMNAKSRGIKVVYDQSYPPNQMDFASIVRSIQAANPDLVFVASYPPDSAGIIRAVHEQGLKARLFGGGMIGLQFAALKEQLGPMLNGILYWDLYVPAPTMKFPGVEDFLKRYQAKVAGTGVDPLGYYMPPVTYAGMQILGQAVQAVGSIDDAKLAQYLHKTTFDTVIGKVAFADSGEWAKTRILYVQYQNVDGSGLAQFTQPGKQVVIEPAEFRSGELKSPYVAGQS